MQIKYLYIRRIISFTVTVELAAVSGLSLHSNFQLYWKFHNVRTPHCVITTLIQPITRKSLKVCFTFTLRLLYTILAVKKKHPDFKFI